VNLSEFLRKDSQKPLLRLATAGSVDDGKSTLIGRLLNDTKNIFTDQIAAAKKASRNFENGFDFSLITDGLRAEREQGITIDVAYRYFSTPHKKYILSDTPGHEQYTRNMATGASNADIALVLVDARKGVLTQTKRHTFIASLLGIKRICVAINKMDLVGYDQDVFDKIKTEYTDFASKLNISSVRFFPISALHGDNVAKTSNKMAWHKNESLLEYLDELNLDSDRNLTDLRMPIQMVTRAAPDFRGYAGQILSGVIKKDDDIVVQPSGQATKVKSISTFDGELAEATVGMSVTIELEKHLDVGRGDMLAHPDNLASTYNNFEAMTVWMSEQPMSPSQTYLLQFSCQTTKVSVEKPEYVIDVNTLERLPSQALGLNEIGRVSYSCHKTVCWDPYAKNRNTGSFIIIDNETKVTVGAGMIIDQSLKLPKPITLREREEKFRQKGCVVWLTGLSGAGKSTISMIVEHELFTRGFFCVRLDGDDLRSGLNQDLGFSKSARKENIRRTAEMGRLLAESGIIAVAALISPLEADREMAREIIGSDRFFEVFVQTSLEECERRDPKGLYKKAREGKISEFTGISSPYEVPTRSDLVIKSEKTNPEGAAQAILDLLKKKVIT
jgi:bifunctional enzyme CysN/CysC